MSVNRSLGIRHGVQWLASDAPVSYPDALAFMEARVEAIRQGAGDECAWLLEHPPLYTAGTSAAANELLDPNRFPVFRTGRGGRHTYHGPGQRVAYVMLNLAERSRDVHAFVHALEDWVIAALADLGVRGERRPDRIGIWVDRGGGREDKIAAIGVRVRRWVTFHGIAVNANPDLEHFSGIVPCGITDHGVTSLADLGLDSDMARVDAALMARFGEVFD